MRRSSLSKAVQIIPILFLAGCAGTTVVDIAEPPPPVVCEREPVVDVINLKDTPPTLIAEDPFRLEGTPPLWLPNPDANFGYWFSSDLYASLAENLQAMRKNATQLRAVVRYYRACIIDHNAALAAEEEP